MGPGQVKTSGKRGFSEGDISSFLERIRTTTRKWKQARFPSDLLTSIPFWGFAKQTSLPSRSFLFYRARTRTGTCRSNSQIYRMVGKSHGSNRVSQVGKRETLSQIPNAGRSKKKLRFAKLGGAFIYNVTFIKGPG